MTDGVFSTPPVWFQTTALGFEVFVDASFSQVTPESGSGVIDAEGNVRFRTALTVDLNTQMSSGGDAVARAGSWHHRSGRPIVHG